MRIMRKCPICQRVNLIRVTESQLNEYINEKIPAEKCFKNMNPVDIETIKSGKCVNCQ